MWEFFPISMLNKLTSNYDEKCFRKEKSFLSSAWNFFSPENFSLVFQQTNYFPNSFPLEKTFQLKNLKIL